MYARLFLCVALLACMPGCSYFSTSASGSVEYSKPVDKKVFARGKKIDEVLKSSDKPIITATKNGGKKYFLQTIVDPVPPMPCMPSAFDEFPTCFNDFGFDGHIETTIHFVDAKGFVYDTEYNWKVLPANNGNIEYDKDPKPDADSQLDFKLI